MRIYKITNTEFVTEYVSNGLSTLQIAEKYKMSMGTVSTRLNRLVGRGEIRRDLVDSRKNKKKLPSGDVLKELYLDKGMGCLKIANLYGTNQQNVHRKLKKLGIIDSSRPTVLTQ